MNTKELLINLRACKEAREWAGDKTIEQIVFECHRGDWLLWLGARVDIGLEPLTLAKGHCANTVRHLMKDERSLKAVDTAIAFGEGKANENELKKAAASAFASHASYAAFYAASDGPASYAASYAASAYAAYAVRDAGAYAIDDSVAAAKENLLQTADICRKYIGDLIIEKVKEICHE